MADRHNHFRTTIEEDTQEADKNKTQAEIKTEDHKIIQHKNKFTNVETHLAQTIYNHDQPKTKSAQNV